MPLYIRCIAKCFEGGLQPALTASMLLAKGKRSGVREMMNRGSIEASLMWILSDASEWRYQRARTLLPCCGTENPFRRKEEVLIKAEERIAKSRRGWSWREEARWGGPDILEGRR